MDKIIPKSTGLDQNCEFDLKWNKKNKKLNKYFGMNNFKLKYLFYSSR